jgi:hypothetical protein
MAAVGKDDGDPEKYANLLQYRFSVAKEGDAFHIIRDFTRQAEFTWMPELYEHEARLKVTVVNTKTKQTGKRNCRFGSVRVQQGRPRSQCIRPTLLSRCSVFLHAPRAADFEWLSSGKEKS